MSVLAKNASIIRNLNSNLVNLLCDQKVVCSTCDILKKLYNLFYFFGIFCLLNNK